MSLIKLTIDALKQRLDKNNSLTVQLEDGYVEKMQMTFNPPATNFEINKLPFSLPKDYEEFLRLHNGGLLFNGPDGGDGLTLYTTEQILEKVTYQDYPEGWFPIADGYDGCYLVITQQNVDGGYLFWMEDGVSFEDDMFLGMTFEDWFEKLIIAQGTKFWEWRIRRIFS